MVHSYFHRRCKASSVFLFYSEKYSPLGRPGKSSRVRVCPQVCRFSLRKNLAGSPVPDYDLLRAARMVRAAKLKIQIYEYFRNECVLSTCSTPTRSEPGRSRQSTALGRTPCTHGAANPPAHDRRIRAAARLHPSDRRPIPGNGQYTQGTLLDDGNRLTMQMPEGRFRLHDNAVGQAAEKMNVPSRYLRELAGGTSWKRALAARILNEHTLWSDRSRVLVRAVGDEVRGILSDSYRRLDSQRILSAFLGKALEQGAVAYDALWTDTKIYVETILPQPICIPTEFNGEVQIYMGARFSTSDFGDGAVDIRVFLLNGVCLNGMVRENVMKQIHLGGKLPDNIQLSQRTYELDTQTTVSAVNDLTSQLFGRDNIRRKALEIKAAAAKEVNFTQELERLMQKGRLLKTENEGVRKLLMNNNPDDGFAGGPTLWKLTQAITAYARETQPARQRELHELSGELLNRVNN